MDTNACSQADLVVHVVDRYHESLRRDVPALVAAARKIERVHADKTDVPHGLAEALEEFWAELQRHMTKEEQVLFPMLSRGAYGTQVYMPVRVMEHEHEEHAAHLEKFRVLTHDFTAPDHACGTWRTLYAGLGKLEQELTEHIHLENNVLFHRAISSR
jgi:regulator of cell morphogenesis and NO signaling